MNDQLKRHDFEANIKSTLDYGAQALDEATLQRLAAARRKALASRADTQRWWRPAGALAIAASLLVAVAVVVLMPPQADIAPALDDMSMLSANEGLDFYEDLEFYRWLSESPDAG